ncbi:ABC transporter ATP-binding protein/permease [Streptomyces sp. NBC_00481]|uniref:ABC transporter ATP-binding protein n=1 Tax=Streptomyces sp. NBC_00481 TaxID=2975755 RepID=UPI002DD81BE6|nr:ABC transporter ATP-binding protein [Streptomyces sp. NBC_00481]WRZ00395.1 ABC transporter ATP-binding protein/permease [Streptomyces sp. NBC_00481]
MRARTTRGRHRMPRGPALRRKTPETLRSAAETTKDALPATGGGGIARLPVVLGWTLFLLFKAAPVLSVVILVLQVVASGTAGFMLVELGDVLAAADAAARRGAPLSAITTQVVLLAAVFITVALAGMLLNSLNVILAEKVTWHVSERVLDVAVNAEAVHFDTPDFHDRLTRAQAAAARPALITQNLLGFVGSTSTLVSLSGVLTLLSPWLLPLMVLVAVPPLVARSRFSRGIHRLTREHSESDRRRGYLQTLLTSRGSATEVRTYGLAGFLRDRNDALHDVRQAGLHRTVRQAISRFLVGSTLSTAILIGCVVLLAELVLSGQVPLAVATVGGATMLQFSGALSVLVVSTNQLYESALYIADFREFHVLLPALRAARARNEGVPAPHDFETITVENVTFTYPEAPRPAVDGVSLTLRRGELIALVGGNGSGKTTLAKLLSNLYQPQQGRIAWDGTDIADVDPDQLRDSVGVLFQDFGRYLLSVAENIGVGRVGDLTDQVMITAAGRRAGVDEFVCELPDGYDTQLGRMFTGGTDLSGGQWQSLALARVFFRAAPLVILDEPTAAMDPVAEQNLYRGIRELYVGRTVLLISHRLTSTRHADRIYVLDQGRLAEEGTHQQLMDHDGVYARLYRIQDETQSTGLTGPSTSP